MKRDKKQRSSNAKIRFLLIGVIGLIILIIVNQIVSGIPFGMREVKSFQAYGACPRNNDPACGYCPGSVTNDRCFVKFGSYSQYR